MLAHDYLINDYGQIRIELKDQNRRSSAVGSGGIVLVCWAGATAITEPFLNIFWRQTKCLLKWM